MGKRKTQKVAGGNPPVFEMESMKRGTFFGTDIWTALVTKEPKTSTAE